MNKVVNQIILKEQSLDLPKLVNRVTDTLNIELLPKGHKLVSVSYLRIPEDC